MVELHLRGTPISTVYTDGQGKFGFGPLTSNIYHVVIRDERFFPVDERVTLDVSLNSTQIVQILLTRRAEAKENVTSPPIAGNPHLVDPEEYRRRFPKAALKEFDKGVKSEQKGNRDAAIRHYQRALQLAPDLYPAHNNLGAAYLSNADFGSAQAQFEHAIRLNQGDAQGHFNLANVFLMTRQYEKAWHSVQEGLRREPNSAFGFFSSARFTNRRANFRKRSDRFAPP